jgi:hypothetical protein
MRTPDKLLERSVVRRLELRRQSILEERIIAYPALWLARRSAA